ncbi:hypothetical protein BHE74_00044892, partial [Ensete ventricosum]
MFKHYASVHFFWSLYFLEENVERDAVHKALMSLLRQDVKGNPKLSVSDLYKSWAELVQVFPIKAELLKPQVEMERHVTNLVKKVILILFCRLYMIFLWQLPEERKLDLLKNVAVSSPYATAQDSRQLLPSIVTLLKILYSNFDVPQKYMPRRKTEGPKYDYLECLFFSFHHLAHKKTIKILLRGRLNSTEEVVRSAMKKLTQGVADHNKALSAAKTEEEKANTKTEQQRATMALRNCNNILAMTQVRARERQQWWLMGQETQAPQLIRRQEVRESFKASLLAGHWKACLKVVAAEGLEEEGEEEGEGEGDGDGDGVFTRTDPYRGLEVAALTSYF